MSPSSSTYSNATASGMGGTVGGSTVGGGGDDDVNSLGGGGDDGTVRPASRNTGISNLSEMSYRRLSTQGADTEQQVRG